MRSPSQAANSVLARLSMATVVGFAGTLIVAHTAAYQLRSSSSDVAHQLAPYDGRITAIAAAYHSTPEATAQDRRKGDALASLALRQDATAVIAASTLGLNAQVADQTPRARRLFAYAESLSRSDIQTQLWAIEDAVSRNNVTEALKHYDIVLRTKPSLGQMLFPVLTTASTDPQIRLPLIRTLAGKPSWGESFVSHVAANSADPRSTARLLADLPRAGVSVPDGAKASVIKALIDNGYFDEAWNYYASVRPQADRRRSRDPRFVQSTNTPTALDWTASEGEAVSASIQRGGPAGVLEFSAPAMVGGVVLRQAQLLPAGEYKLVGHSVGVEPASGPGAYWTIACQNHSEIGRVSLGNLAKSNGNFSGTFVVPKGCPLQILSLMVEPSEEISGQSGRIDYVQLSPVSPAKRG